MKTVILISTLMALVLITGCGASGTKFQKVAFPKDLAVVYLYRKPAAWGAAISALIKANGSEITRMTNGGYFPFVTEPGKITFSGKLDFGIIVSLTAPFQVVGFQEIRTLEVRPGEVYYLRGKPKGSFFALELVTDEVGRKEISGLKRF